MCGGDWPSLQWMREQDLGNKKGKRERGVELVEGEGDDDDEVEYYKLTTLITRVARCETAVEHPGSRYPIEIGNK